MKPDLSQLKHVTVRSPEDLDLSAFPNFLIIGPQRTGTTWLYHNLKKHPEIFLPQVKETYYFSTLGQPDHPHFRYEHLEDYLAALRDRPKLLVKKNWNAFRKHGRFYHPRVRGEATASYAKLTKKVD